MRDRGLIKLWMQTLKGSRFECIHSSKGQISTATYNFQSIHQSEQRLSKPTPYTPCPHLYGQRRDERCNRVCFFGADLQIQLSNFQGPHMHYKLYTYILLLTVTHFHVGEICTLVVSQYWCNTLAITMRIFHNFHHSLWLVYTSIIIKCKNWNSKEAV